MIPIENLYRRERKRLLAWIRYRVSDPEDAEDLLQESFYQALTELDSAGTIEYLVAYLYAVVRNKIGDWYRRKKSKAHIRPELESEFGLEDRIQSREKTPEQDFYRQLILEELALAIEELPHEQRFAFVENVIHRRTFREISQETGVPEGTLSARKTYAKEFLSRRLQELKPLFLEEFN
ncbi:RNA polymerase subunit sigma-24 [Leptospira perolatii]|uniref:RNA polymerase subunit sigma-24 n=1 Tax=Leptospira perolatii TaxID=2023191 RepID=A0A2M9ZKT3_9LEPT|nr:sigma-70 family RNA polymerase sigma factor [Leptospira perolatii]PJZ69910.1 RNA polymerase subunit sigma-24 [Leptospira perolatii]PJZ72682.1 RNA polymerase subunit sigma-24 [Leptospira perolatii]